MYKSKTFKLALVSITAELALAALIIYTPAGNGIVGVAPLPWRVWLVLVPFMLLLFAAEEGRKWLAQRRMNTARAV